MADVSRPVDKKIADAVERMRRVQEAAKGLKAPERPEPATSPPRQPSIGNR